ncbi:MAG TPA: thymidine phosphorylase family protein [Caulobacteraceae bacterium]|nr:thymidine phosphorylase family protein [Caulobacteraceae bacterium]
MLKIKALPVDTLRENVLVLSRDCVALRPERLSGSRKVEVRANGRSLFATIVIADDAALVGATEAGLTMPLFRRLGAAEGVEVDIAPARPPASLDAVRDKIHGATLDGAALDAVVGDIVTHAYSDMEIAAFLIACASFMTPDETLALTRSMIASGSRLTWQRPLVVDKHCIGGIPGNRTSLIVAPIVAAHGLLIPKTSSRAITSPAGTADTMEVLARVDLSEDEMRAVVGRCGACIVWGGRVDLSPADDVLISVERPLGVDTPEQMVASILSKKVAAGSTHLVIDLPVGPSAKVRDADQALHLRKLFEFVGRRLGLVMEIAITDGEQPIGRGIGPVLEARDVRAVLENRPDAPFDLRDKAIALAGRVLEFDPELPGGRGVDRARELLESGAAAQKMDAIIEAQGPSPCAPVLGRLTYEVTARADGWIEGVDCARIGRVARLAGAPTDVGAGVDLIKRKGDSVRAGEPLYRIHGVDPADFGFARDAANEDPGFRVIRT